MMEGKYLCLRCSDNPSMMVYCELLVEHVVAGLGIILKTHDCASFFRHLKNLIIKKTIIQFLEIKIRILGIACPSMSL